VADTWVANASPVIVLAKIGYLHLLKELPQHILVPQAVFSEILAGPASDPARQAFESGWTQPVSPEPIPNEFLEWGLGAGETAVLALARSRPASEAILDDAAARACAKAFGVPLLGTLGIALRAKKRGLVASAGEVLKAARAAGLHLDDRTIRMALGHVGEAWAVDR
jgi:predicted nucleic acid-binding protein